MFTQCPHCKTVLGVSTQQLRLGLGRGRCGKCQTVFNVLVGLTDCPDEPDSYARPPQPEQPPCLPVTLPAQTLANPFLEPALRQPTPGNQRLWAFSSIWLIGLLAAQLAFLHGPRMVQNATLRPWLARACTTLGCRLPPYRNPKEIEVLHRELEKRPDNLLEFALVVQNRAAFPQPLPALQLQLLSLGGTVIAERVFRPGDYADSAVAGSRLPVGRPVPLRLVIAEPVQGVGGFRFELL